MPTLNGLYNWSSFYSKTLGETSDNFSDQFKRNKSQQVAFGLNIPVFNKLQIKNNVEIAKLNVINFNYEKEIVINNLTQTIKSIKAQYQNSEEKIHPSTI